MEGQRSESRVTVIGQVAPFSSAALFGLIVWFQELWESMWEAECYIQYPEVQSLPGKKISGKSTSISIKTEVRND